ncbi:MAG: response regulator transcription factor [Bacteroidales bacterium]|nr:response regulator transcription factor [Bacteroidales bacterium]
MKILIVDDHALIRKGLKALLMSCNPTWEVYEAINGIQAVIQAPKLNPNLVLMDYSMPKLDGFRASNQLLRDLPEVKIIMISGFISSESIKLMFTSGIMGIVSKTAGNEEILEAIHLVMNGKQHLMAESWYNIQDELASEKDPKKTPKEGISDLLTRRELEVMRLIIEGSNNEMITQQLAMSPRTLAVHKSNIFRKCNLHSTSELVRFAYKNNLA